MGSGDWSVMSRASFVVAWRGMVGRSPAGVGAEAEIEMLQLHLNWHHAMSVGLDSKILRNY